MDPRLSRLDKELKNHDSKLFAIRLASGMIHVRRKASNVGDSDFDIESGNSGPPSYFVCALSDNWSQLGNPVDWGIEPVLDRIKTMDLWASHHSLKDMRERREREQRDKERQNKNEIRAKALDLRKDFAKAVNDINTSSLEKLDNRRSKDGYCK